MVSTETSGAQHSSTATDALGNATSWSYDVQGHVLTELQERVHDPQRVRFAGSYPMACGEGRWPVAYAEPAA